MDFKALLNQVITSGGDMANQAKNQFNQQTGQTKQAGMSDMTKGAIGGAVGGSLLTMLVGSKKGRKMGKKAAQLGGTAALGALAYKVFNDWQANSAANSQLNQANSQGAQSAQAVSSQPTQMSSVTAQQIAMPEQTQDHAMLVLKAMIAAAKADGHVDNEERQRIHQAIVSLGATAEVSQFVDNELNKPLNPADVAQGVTCPEQAAELYLASVAMVDEQNFMEKAYLKELASQLGLQPELTARLEAQLA